MRYVHIVIHNGRPIGCAYTSRLKADQKAVNIHHETFVKPEVVSIELK